MTQLFIKNMVCPRCIKVVTEELKKLGLNPVNVQLGEVELNNSPEEIDIPKLKSALEKEGFELIEDSKGRLVDEIKTEIISIIQKYKEENLEQLIFSKYLSEKFGKDYSYLSNLFSKMEGITIEHYIILQKIEKAKELLKYGEMTLSEIAWELGYSSVQHLSRQFKQVTGMTASQFKNNISNQRRPIDKITG
ncbi:MAG: AraC family transcriptional regulator [Ignavibacteria bacterium]|nr:MAG: AraC family transcriptional regulator [Ignavibacteria bacterium]